MFSVIVPMYNVEKFAVQCIESILNQSYKDFELILVDDGSTDRTPEIIDFYAQKDNRILPIHKKNGGPNAARKEGAKVSHGDYVVFVDGDDWIDGVYLMTFFGIIKELKPDIIINNGYTKSAENYHEQVVESFLNIGTYCKNDENFQNYLKSHLLQSLPTLWAKCFERKQYYKMQMMIHDSISMGEDGCIVYPLIANADKISVIENNGYHYRVNTNSLTRRKDKLIPFEAAIWRIKHLKESLPKDDCIDKQMALYTSHALFNAILTNMRAFAYSDVVDKAKNYLCDDDIAYYFNIRDIKGPRKVMLARFVLKKKLFFIVKIYSWILKVLEKSYIMNFKNINSFFAMRKK